MDLDVFFEHCENNEYTEIADEALNVLTRPIAQKDLEKYNFLDNTLKLLTYWEYYKEFETLIKLKEGLKKHNPSLYQEVDVFINDSLISYYCFKGASPELIEDCLNEVYTPDNETDIDLLMSSLWQCVYYGHTEIADSFIEREYKNLEDSGDADEDSLKDMALLKLNIELGKVNASSTKPDKSKFIEKLSQYGFHFKEDIVTLMYKGLDLTINDDLKTKVLGKFKDMRHSEMIILKGVFMKYMLDKNCSFAISGIIWEHLVSHWESKDSIVSWLGYLSFKERSFRVFLDEHNGLFMPNKADLDVALVWFGSYVVEFIEALRLEQPAHYAPQKKMFAKLKKEFKEEQKNGLWRYSFVHRWTPVNEMFTKEYEEEKQLFIENYDEKPEELSADDFERQEGVLGGLMEMMNDLMGEDGGASWLDNEDDDEAFFDDPFALDDKPQRRLSGRASLPVQKVQTFRRNDKVTATYQDGTVKKNVKYKTVQTDHEKGLCTVEA